jgi:hypothetical protein
MSVTARTLCAIGTKILDMIIDKNIKIFINNKYE